MQTYIVRLTIDYLIFPSIHPFYFQVDSYALHAASAIAGVVSFRAFAGFAFPLFADKMYGVLGYGE
jgi:hypothetical protein